MLKTECLARMCSVVVAQKTSADKAVSREPGVEPELRNATPRRVADSKPLREWRAACANIAIGALLVIWYLYTHLDPMPNGLLAGCVLIFSLFALLWAGQEYEARCERKLLRYGDVTRAIVTRRDILLGGRYAVHMVTYTYKRPDGKTETGRLSLPESVAESYGGLSVGKQFTVLLDPLDPTATVPYFRIVYTRIPGAASARTTLRHFSDFGNA